MQNAAPSIDFNEPDSNGIIPLIVGFIALVLLVYTVKNTLHRIPAELSSQAQSILSESNAGDVKVAINGRDLNLSGTLAAGVNRDELVERISRVSGMRVVVDDMVEFDPKAQAKLESLAFNRALQNLDFSRVAFEQGSTSLTDDSRVALLQLVQVLRTSPSSRIRISGHTDNTGRPEVNLRISRERAQAVADFLTQNGVESDQLIAQGYGATRPIADNATEAGRTANRRIEINYVP
jgi:outer membrane protein OmpA-like peptidoglycan-associated protein